MERFPQNWLWEPLDGPYCYRATPFFLEFTGNSRTTYECLLCQTGEMNSEKVCKGHVRGQKHQRRYKLLSKQQKSFHQELLLPDDLRLHFEETLENNLPYILPFRRWQYGRWMAGSSCQLCGTAALPTRLAVAEHFLSKRHQTIRAKTYEDYHDECRSLDHRVQRLPSFYKWHVERAMIQYVARKEASFAGLTSHPVAWYDLNRTLETYELRECLVYVELAIWKHALLSLADDRVFATLDDLWLFLQENRESYKKTKRFTSGVAEIIQGVLPFLRSYPKLL
eukprot:scaffold8505_cov130-Cylindrotheca_fusiformis.AAC.11